MSEIAQNGGHTLKPGCKWVKLGDILRPTDFHIWKNVTAESVGLSWEQNENEVYWQRYTENNPDLLHLMKAIKVSAHKLPEADKQRRIWEMQQVIREAAAKLVYIREETEKDVFLKVACKEPG